MKFSRHVSNIKPGVSSFQILAKVREMEASGQSVINMSIGEPDLDTPDVIKQAAIKAMMDNKTHYSPSAGIPELREVIAEYETKRKGVEVKPTEVVVLPGGKPVLLYSILALADEGDEVIYFEPAFTSYSVALEMGIVKPVPVPLYEADGFKFRSDVLADYITEKTRFIILNSPHNPTGSMVSIRELEELSEIVLEHPNLIVLSDEVYSTLVFNGTKHHSILSLPGMKERTIILESFSKSFAMTGWRLGYGIFPEPMVKDVVNLISHTISCTTTFVQYAGIAALTQALDEVEKMRKIFQKRKELVVKMLRETEGVTFVEPKGAFYAFPNIKATGMTSLDFANYLLDEFRVAAIPGTSYGKSGEGYLRFSFATKMDLIEEGLERFRQAVYSKLPSRTKI